MSSENSIYPAHNETTVIDSSNSEDVHNFSDLWPWTIVHIFVDLSLWTIVHIFSIYYCGQLSTPFLISRCRQLSTSSLIHRCCQYGAVGALLQLVPLVCIATSMTYSNTILGGACVCVLIAARF
jgi:hypothetical protein